MKNVFKLILLAAIFALGVWFYFFLFPSPEKIIRRQLTKLARDVSFSKDEGNLVRIAHAENVGDFFSTNVEVDINVPGYEQTTLDTRAEITQAALASRQAINSLAVKFPDINPTVAPDKQSATADVTVEINASNEHDTVFQELKITFEKSEGKWLIKKIETVRTLSILNFEPARFLSIVWA
jgi:outer membrane protein assembly factor BamA